MANTLIDRLLHPCHVTNICGKLFRRRHHTDIWRSLTHVDRLPYP
jgi:hypothetical protein